MVRLSELMDGRLSEAICLFCFCELCRREEEKMQKSHVGTIMSSLHFRLMSIMLMCFALCSAATVFTPGTAYAATSIGITVDGYTGTLPMLIGGTQEQVAAGTADYVDGSSVNTDPTMYDGDGDGTPDLAGLIEQQEALGQKIAWSWYYSNTTYGGTFDWYSTPVTSDVASVRGYFVPATSYTVTISYGNGDTSETEVAAGSSYYATTGAIPTAPTKNGWSFDKWVNTSTQQEYDFYSNVTSNVTVEATYTLTDTSIGTVDADSIPKTITGNLYIGATWSVHPAKFALTITSDNAGGILKGKTGTGSCTLRSAAQPSYVNGSYTAKLQSINYDTGEVTYYLDIKSLSPKPSATAPYSRNSLGIIGYQTIGATITVKMNLGGYIDIQKKSSATSITNDNPNYSLANAQYTIYNSKGTAVQTLTTDSKGYAKSEKLGAGTYTVKETRASSGYAIDGATYQVTVKSGSTSHVNSGSVGEVPQGYDLINLKKLFSETLDIASPGAASLANTVFEVNYYSISSSASASTISSATPTRTYHIKTDENGELDMSSIEEDFTVSKNVKGSIREYSFENDDVYVLNGETVLPLGVLTIQEVLAPEGYVTDNGTENTGTLKTIALSAGSLTETDPYLETDEIEVQDDVIRGDINFSKQEAITEKPLGNVAFVIESKTTGEWHVVVTDTTGIIDTSSSWNPHTDYANGNDAYVTKNDDDTYTVTNESALNSTYGIYFTGFSNDDVTWTNNHKSYVVDGNTVSVNDTLGALPYDDYVIKELRTLSNTGLSLISDIEFTVNRNNVAIDLGTFKDYAVEISTTAIDSTTYSSVGYADPSSNTVTITDEISYNNVTAGTTYKLVGTVTDKDTGDALTYNGKTITATKTFKADSTSGTVTMEFTVPRELVEGDAVTIFEELYEGDALAASHTVQGLDSQTVYYPALETSASDAITGTKEGSAVDTTTINDIVSYSGLKPNQPYTMVGSLVDSLTGNTILDEYGNEITATVDFMADAETGTVSMSFEDIPISDYAGRSITVIEKLYYYHILVGEHQDLTDIDQTIHFPSVSTKAYDSKTLIDEGNGNRDATIVDEVSYVNLEKGATYTLVTTLMDKETGETLKDSNGDAYTKVTSFVASGTTYGTSSFNRVSGSTKVNIDVEAQENNTVVVYEKLYKGTTQSTKTFLASHEDITDENQTIHYSYVKESKAQDINIDNSEGYSSSERTISDFFFCENLEYGATYTLVTQLIDKETGKTYVDASGQEVKKETIIVANEESGTVLTNDGRAYAEYNVSLTYDASNAAGKSLVVYETLYYGNSTSDNMSVAQHKEIEDAGQTVYYPKIGTSAADFITGTDEGLADEQVKIVDTVSYSNLQKGSQYMLIATLMDKETGEAITDANGNKITATTTFYAGDSQTSDDFSSRTSGKVDVTFTINDGSILLNKQTVVYEELYHGTNTNDRIHVASHNDITDDNQSVYYPQIGTKAADYITGTEEGLAEGAVKLVDTVSYSNLENGATYTVVGTLMDKETGETITDANGNAITSSKQFTAGSGAGGVPSDRVSGTVEVTFEFDGSYVIGKQTVVYEKAYIGTDVKTTTLIAKHEDQNDDNQSVYYPEIHTNAFDSISGYYEGLAEDTVTIDDVVSYYNLENDATYTLVATLTDKETGKAIIDADGNTVTVSRTFVAGEDLSQELSELSAYNNSKSSNDIIQEFFTNLLSNASGLLSDFMNSGIVSNSNNEIGNGVVASEVRVDGLVPISITVDSTSVIGKETVVYEKLYRGDTPSDNNNVANHEDLSDEGQSVYYPLITSDAVDTITGIQEGLANGEASITDTISYQNLEKDAEYIVVSTLMNKETGEAITDADSNIITNTTTFIATATNTSDDATNSTNASSSNRVDGSIDVTIPFNGNDVAGLSVVVYEKIYRFDNENQNYNIANHENINDLEQSVYYPDTSSLAIDEESGGHEAIKDGERTIVDTVSYQNLENGQEYTVVGTLVDKETGETITDADGNAITSYTEFVAGDEQQSNENNENNENDSNGSIDVTNSEDVDDEKTTNEKTSTSDDNVDFVAWRYDADEKTWVKYFNDEDDIEVNEYATSFKKIVSDNGTTKNIEFNKNNDMSWYAHTDFNNGGTGSALIELNYDFDDIRVTRGDVSPDTIADYQTSDLSARVPWVLHEGKWTTLTDLATSVFSNENAEYELTSEVNTDGEYIYYATYSTSSGDTTGKRQLCLKISTNSVLSGCQGWTLFKESTSITTELGKSYLTILNTFAMSDVLLLDEGVTPNNYSKEELTDAEKAADRVNGEVKVNFAFDSSILNSGTAVVYENIYRGNANEVLNNLANVNTETQDTTNITISDSALHIATHEDINDEAQSIYYPTVGTEATSNGSHADHASSEMTIIDNVSYTNLESGQAYRVEGVLMDKATGEELLDSNGDVVTASTEFVPENGNGTTEVTFVFDALSSEWHDTVVFEKLYKVGASVEGQDLLVGTHEDINDEAQTVSILEALVADDLIMLQTGDYLPFVTAIIMAAAASVGIGIRQKRRAAATK